MTRKTLQQIAAEKPYREFTPWWPMGETFLTFMADAITSQWRNLPHNSGDLAAVTAYTADYLQTVYDRPARAELVADFAAGANLTTVQSGEFDALSYAFFRAAFELIEAHPGAYDEPVAQERRRFTQRVGRVFFRQMSDHLGLDIPARLADSSDFEQFIAVIEQVGHFLREGGYLRDHFAFRFDVGVTQQGRQITQATTAFLNDLQQNGVAYALYEMGYPAILPSAVYLYHTIGEAQHHSSRTIEELFARAGCDARETDDFDPTGYPADLVVELWEIRART
jgi:hypothetical protein